MTELTKEKIIDIIKLSEAFRIQSFKLDSKPQFRVRNPLTYLGALETHISHIFADILKYEVYDQEKEKLRYPILESFIDRFFKDQNEGFIVPDLNVESPKIFAEFGNIDIFIKDKQYVIIVENKIKDATYQASQPAKYVQKHKCRDSKVLVVLLPKKMKSGEEAYITTEPKWSLSQDPDNKIIDSNNMSNINISYKCPGSKETKGEVDCYVRALHTNFSKWLSDVIKTIPMKETSLISNILILVEYLNSLYGTHQESEFEQYEKEKICLLKTILGFTDDLNGSNLEQLCDCKKEINALNIHITDLNNKINELCRTEIEKFILILRKEIETLITEDNEKTKKINGETVSWVWPDQPNANCIYPQTLIKNDTISLGITCNNNESKIYVHAYCTNGDPKSTSLKQEDIDAINKVLSTFGMHELNTKYRSEQKAFLFSEKDDIIKLIRNLLQLKFIMPGSKYYQES